MKKIITLVLILSFISSFANASEPKLKSERTARILSFMPLNSPALFYVNRPIRGTLYTALEGSGIYFLAIGTDALIAFSENDGKPDLLGIKEIGKAVGISCLIIGGVLFLPPWIHTAVATPGYVDKANEKIKVKAAAVSFAPMIDIKDNGNAYGLQLRYRF